MHLCYQGLEQVTVGTQVQTKIMWNIIMSYALAWAQHSTFNRLKDLNPKQRLLKPQLPTPSCPGPVPCPASFRRPHRPVLWSIISLTCAWLQSTGHLSGERQNPTALHSFHRLGSIHKGCQGRPSTQYCHSALQWPLLRLQTFFKKIKFQLVLLFQKGELMSLSWHFLTMQRKNINQVMPLNV